MRRESRIRGAGRREHNRKQRGGRIKGSVLRTRGAWLRITRAESIGSRERGARSKEPAGRSGENPGARCSWAAGTIETRPGDRGPEAASGPGEGPCPRSPQPPRPLARALPSGPPRARAHRPHGLLQQCPEPAQHDGGPARPGWRPGSGWRCGGGGGGGGGPAGGRRDPALEPRPCRRAGGALSAGRARSSGSPPGRAPWGADGC